MTGVVILNVVLIVTVVTGIVGLLTWRVLSSNNRPGDSRTRSHRTARRYCMPEVYVGAAEPRVTASLTLAHASDTTVGDG
jgi:hypothetical protein